MVLRIDDALNSTRMCMCIEFVIQVVKQNNAHVSFPTPEGPRIEKIQSREAILKKSSFQYGMKFSIENEIFIPGPSLAAEKQGLGLKFSIENEIFKPRMKISSENENFVRGGMVFSCVRARMNFFDPRALWDWDRSTQVKNISDCENSLFYSWRLGFWS